MKNTIVISGFPGVGKSEVFRKAEELGLSVSDSDSSEYSWLRNDKGELILDQSGEKQRNPNATQDYMEEIRGKFGKVDLLLVSSHPPVRQALIDEGIRHTLVYPSIDSKDEYLKRYQADNREVGVNSGDAFVHLLSQNWESWVGVLEEQPATDLVDKKELQSGQFLSDVVDEIINRKI